MKNYKIILTLTNNDIIEGTSSLTKEEAERRIADFFKLCPDFKDGTFSIIEC